MSLRLVLVSLIFALAACAAGVERPAAGPAAATDAPGTDAPGPVRAAQTRTSPQPEPRPALRVPESRGQIQLSFAPVVRKAAPAVVNIYARKVVAGRRSPFGNDPFLREFFGDVFRDMPGARRIENSLGSGVILDPAGIVVSNHHVVAGADEITVVLADKREFEGRVIFADEQSDLAVVQLKGAHDLPALDIRDSDTLEVGDLVLAIGNPFGVGQTVTSGIVSGLARSGAGRRLRDGYYIQTDAAINPGNSGGALVDMDGRLIGVNTAILSRSGGSNGIGFAVPANLVARVVEAARTGEAELERPWLGIDGAAVTGDLAEALGLEEARGVVIEALHPASRLAAAGLEPGDVLTGLGGQKVDSMSELNFRAATLGTGRGAEVSYLRDGEPRRASVRLVAAPEIPPREETLIRRGALRGLELVSVNPAVIQEAGLPVTTRGVLVVRARDVSRRVGLRGGDVILSADGQEVRKVGELLDAFRSARTRIVLEILRNGRRGQLVIGG
ncbi:Do family serine endopeptidase [Paralimibaculum aggregatum]|uniref:Do family serine endopeptidase n=1 Tax=Paralimibaculum aggregatum TaxID=3036245 RepID=A0ABQ6LRC0_9RHOB|nr:Do family serine endopeptidase [Limibaculum sp. NKW23]GMG83849.1 Do family serine endopeptidase [Limibaculum sp. NKW23]